MKANVHYRNFAADMFSEKHLVDKLLGSTTTFITDKNFDLSVVLSTTKEKSGEMLTKYNCEIWLTSPSLSKTFVTRNRALSFSGAFDAVEANLLKFLIQENEKKAKLKPIISHAQPHKEIIVPPSYSNSSANSSLML